MIFLFIFDFRLGEVDSEARGEFAKSCRGLLLIRLQVQCEVVALDDALKAFFVCRVLCLPSLEKIQGLSGEREC